MGLTFNNMRSLMKNTTVVTFYAYVLKVPAVKIYTFNENINISVSFLKKIFIPYIKKLVQMKCEKRPKRILIWNAYIYRIGTHIRQSSHHNRNIYYVVVFTVRLNNTQGTRLNAFCLFFI